MMTENIFVSKKNRAVTDASAPRGLAVASTIEGYKLGSAVLWRNVGCSTMACHCCTLCDRYEALRLQSEVDVHTSIIAY